jgi:hypothetical protein
MKRMATVFAVVTAFTFATCMLLAVVAALSDTQLAVYGTVVVDTGIPKSSAPSFVSNVILAVSFSPALGATAAVFVGVADRRARRKSARG